MNILITEYNTKHPHEHLLHGNQVSKGGDSYFEELCSVWNDKMEENACYGFRITWINYRYGQDIETINIYEKVSLQKPPRIING